MKIASNKVTSIHYTLKDKDGILIDTSEGQAPLSYIHGAGNLIPGMEQGLEGKSAGDKLSLAIHPQDAYGLRDDQLIVIVPISNFPNQEELKVGMQFVARSEQGSRSAVVLKIEGDNVTVDFNHPLAGMELHFDVEVLEVREATEEELKHGHVHGDGCCGH